MEELDLYEMVIDEEMDDLSGMNYVSLVRDPAMEVLWQKFSGAVTMKFDKAKQELVGALIIPDKPIVREQPPMGRFNVIFRRPTIEAILRKFQKNDYSNNINLHHSDREVDGFINEVWIKEFEEDKSNAFGFSLPVGTLFAKVKIEDSHFWETRVETDEVRGFSIEIMSGLQPVKMAKEDKYKRLFEEMAKIIEETLN